MDSSGNQMKALTVGQEKRHTTGALAIWRGEEYFFSFFITTQFWFRQTNNAEQQNKQ
jgi:hypothetical protein